MIGYGDKTYCPFWKKCKSGDECKVALTDIVKAKAVKWWGGEDAPIMVYTEAPVYCFIKKEEEGEVLENE